MLFFLVSLVSFGLLLSQSRPLKLLLLQPLPSWATEMRLLSNLFLRDFLRSAVHLFKTITGTSRPPVSVTRAFLGILSAGIMFPKRRCSREVDINPMEERPEQQEQQQQQQQQEEEEEEEEEELSILDLPELALECILEKLSPTGLSNMAAVCNSMRDRCHSNYFWEKHMDEKWGRVIGEAARREWKLFLASRNGSTAADGGGGGGVAAIAIGSAKQKKKWLAALSCVWPISWLKSRIDGDDGKPRINIPSPNDSIKSLFVSLESGKFWFPAQIYNREHGHVGFMLSCYDAEVSYDCNTDTFHARYPPHGRRTIVIEDGVEWDRLRAPPVETPAHDLHISDCLLDLRPGDHIEIQWRRNKEFPYGWWYGIVGHLESCDGSSHFCRCHLSNTAILEFNQYTPGSRWRRSSIDRNNHREEGNETDGFYGGIRKLKSPEEIAKWKQLWPTDVLE